MKLSFRISRDNLFIFLLLAGLLIHNFALSLGLSVKFLHFAILYASLIFCHNKFRIKNVTKIEKYLLFYFGVICLYLIGSNVNTVFGVSSLKFTIYILLIILFSFIFMFKSSLFVKKFDSTLKIYIIIISVAILCYLYISFFMDNSIYISGYREINTVRGLMNSIYAFVLPEYGGLFMRFNGYNLDPNVWGVYALFSFWMIVLFEKIVKYSKRSYSRPIFKLALFLSVVSIIITFSRGALLSFIGSYIIYVFFSFNFKKNLAFFTLILILVSLYLYLYHYNEDFQYLIELKSSNDVAENPRLEKWDFYINYLFNSDFYRVLFGFGIIDLFTWYNGTTMHNTYIQILVSLGFVGMLFYVLFLVFSVRAMFFKSNTLFLPVQLAMLFSVLVSSVFVDMFFSVVFWVGSIMPFYSLILINKVRNNNL